MKITEFSVARPQFTLIVFVALLFIGISSMLAIPKAEDPTIPGTTFSIVAVVPGASVQDLERLVADPIEAKLKTLDDVKSMKTQMEDGVLFTILEFRAEIDGDRKHDEVEREVSALRSELPKELVKLEVTQFRPSNVTALQVALVSPDASYRDLDLEARRIEKRLESVKGTGDAKIWGLPKQEVEVALDLPRLAALRISPNEILSRLQADGSNIPGGAVLAGGRRFDVKTSGDYTNLETIKNVVLRGGQGEALRLKDVADIHWKDADPGHYCRFDGQRAVFIAVPLRPQEDIFAVRKSLLAETDALKGEVPKGMRVEVGFDQAENVAHRLSGFLRDFGLAILLVAVTLLPIGLRAAGVVMISVPLSVAIGVTMLHLLGFTINQLSIVGFVIALGLLVDDSVVVVENIARFLREGKAPKDAALLATRQIAVSVLGCTATLVFAFVPLLMLPGGAGQFIRSLPAAVVVTVLASLFVSLTIVPFLASRVLKKESHEGNAIFRVMMRGVEGGYRPVLNYALKHPGRTLAFAAAFSIGSFALIPKIGFSLFPAANLPQFLVTIEAPDGSSLATVDATAKRVETILGEHKEIVHAMTTVGRSNPQVYYNMGAKEERASYGEVFVAMKEYDPKHSPELYAVLRDAFAKIPGARVELKEFEQGPPIDAPIAVRLLGADTEALGEAALAVEKLLVDTQGTTLVRNPSTDRKTDLRVDFDEEKGAIYGVTAPDVDRAVRFAVSGIDAASFRPSTHDDAIPVVVRVARQDAREKASLEIFDRVYVAGDAQVPIPLAQVANLHFEPSPATLRHYNKQRTVVVSSQVLSGYNTDKLTKQITARLPGLALPHGVKVVIAGQKESQDESFGGLGGAILVAIFGIVAVLVLEFETLKQTLVVASVIPLGIAGGFIALLVAGYTLSFTASIGFVALTGIEVKNSILLVDFTNQLRKEGVPLDEAIERAGAIRFVPILLTTLTALGGLIPLTLERSPLYSPLAVVLIGGLISSTLLARIVTPVLFKMLAPKDGAPKADAPLVVGGPGILPAHDPISAE